MKLDNIILENERNTFCVVNNIVNYYTRSYARRMNLILPSWLHKCVAAQCCLPFEEEDFFKIDPLRFPQTSRGGIHAIYPVPRRVVLCVSDSSDDENK
ncbi:hypothetical protein GHT06_001717 [Daphnia sinensis]|uniref:BRCT domain-containing protein n=1 Tax=Daphnia sinensis TaxID=1820382 RepID=A0AAD5KGP3_9CRUS|nr:hypothetical protein GHT06_001717 [Daphnia sinensis]